MAGIFDSYIERLSAFYRLNKTSVLIAAIHLVLFAAFKLNFFYSVFYTLLVFWGSRHLFSFFNKDVFFVLYIAGGISGWLILSLFNAEGSLSALQFPVAVSSAILSVFSGIAFYTRNMNVKISVLGDFPMKYILIFVLIFDAISFYSASFSNHPAHLAGVAAGIISVYIYVTGVSKSNFSFKQKRGFRRVYKNERPVTDEEYNRRKAESNKRIDSILDKISKSGYKNLTEEEKEILFKAGKK